MRARTIDLKNEARFRRSIADLAEPKITLASAIGLELPEIKAPELLPELEAPKPEEFLSSETQEIFVDNDSILSWTASEFEARERGQNWYLVTGGLALVLVLFGIISKSYFFSLFAGLAFLVMIMYERKNPREIQVAVTEEGVRVGKKLWPFKELKSFWIYEKHRELSLETGKPLKPFVLLPLGKTDYNNVREVLHKFIREEEHHEELSDQIARSLGF